MGETTQNVCKRKQGGERVLKIYMVILFLSNVDILYMAGSTKVNIPYWVSHIAIKSSASFSRKSTSVGWNGFLEACFSVMS